MAEANSTSVTTVTVPMDQFDKATLKLEGAAALVTAFGIFASEVDEMPISGEGLNFAMTGIAQLIESAVADLTTESGTA